MKKILAISISLIILMGLLAGCSPSNDGDTGDNDKGGENVSKSVTVYSPHNAEVVNPIIKEFEDETGIEVDLVAAGTGELLKRI